MKTAQQSKKGSEYATPKKNINRISAVDEEHFLVRTVLSTLDTGPNITL